MFTLAVIDAILSNLDWLAFIQGYSSRRPTIHWVRFRPSSITGYFARHTEEHYLAVMSANDFMNSHVGKVLSPVRASLLLVIHGRGKEMTFTDNERIVFTRNID